MNAAEDRLRAAGRAVAVTVPPDSVPPLRLPAPAAPDTHLRGLGRGRPGRRRPGWLAPLAAAAAVVAAIALSVAVARGPFSGAPAGTAASPLGTPAYYVTLAAAGGQAGAAAVVRLTATGLPVARVAAPGSGGRFTLVAGAPDDRTFVLGAQLVLGSMPTGPSSSSGAKNGSRAQMLPAMSTMFYLLRFDPARRQTHLSQLRVPPATERVSGLALSPDGTKLAVATTPPGRMNITVSTLATGASRTWTGRWSRRVPAPPFNSLSWTMPDKVAFAWWARGGGAAGTSVRRLDLAAPGTSLPAASTDLPGVAWGTSTAVSPQGLRVRFRTGLPPYRGIAAWPTDRRWLFLARRSARGTWENTDSTPYTLWSNPAGTVLIANFAGRQIDVVGHGRFVTLPGIMPVNPLGIAW